MTSPSRRKPRTTRPSTKTLSALAVLCVAGVARGQDVFERMAAEPAEVRWERLKRQYLPADAEPPRPVVETVRPAAPKLKVVPAGRSREIAKPTAPDLSDAPGRWRPSPLPFAERAFADEPFALQLDGPDLSSPGDALELEPLEDGDPLKDLLDEAKEDAADDLADEMSGGDEPSDDESEGPSVAERIAEATRLVPLSSIVPAYDYAPEGVDRCTYLCPRPAGCPEGDESATRCPDEAELPTQGDAFRVFAPVTYAWAASNLTYNPLYFEDADLERYGHHYPEWVQPFASGGLFAVQLAALPYQMAIDPPHACVSPLGFHRPGECVAPRKKAVPWNARAAAEAAAVYTGLIYLVP